jgi:hypothetical protein
MSLEQLRETVADVLDPRHFFLGGDAHLEWQGPVHEDLPWEVFQGCLLAPSQTRLRRRLVAWNVFWTDAGGRSAEPILAVKLDAEAGHLHVVRGLLCHVWEGYDAGDNVYLSREAMRWVRELVGTVALGQVADVPELRRALAGLVFRAVIGTSRLPLTSVESPLPTFSLGQLAYFYQPQANGANGTRSRQALLSRALTAECSWSDKAKVLEAVLRSASTAELEAAARHFAGHEAGALPRLLRTVFNEAALSPWTGFVDNALAFVQLLVRQGCLERAAEVDFLSWLLRQLGRHLTAYDLVTFHHRGANYPDALLLDTVLKRYLDLVDQTPGLFTSDSATGRRRRRALRQGCLLRRHYEGLPVPDAPTSPGENARVLPPPHVRVSDEQILQVSRRTRRLYEGDPLDRRLGEHVRMVLQQSMADLDVTEELRELGMAVFIDRPLGVFKAPAEPDRTLLLSHEAFSPSTARDRLRLLFDSLGLAADAGQRAAVSQALQQDPALSGLPLAAVQCEEGRIVSLADVRRAAPDFVLLRTTRQTVGDFLAQYDLAPLAARFALDFLTRDRQALIVPAPSRPGAGERVLTVYDAGLRRRLELGFRWKQGYESRGAMEWVGGGLHALRLWEAVGNEDALRENDLRAEGLILRPARSEPRT